MKSLLIIKNKYLQRVIKMTNKIIVSRIKKMNKCKKSKKMIIVESQMMSKVRLKMMDLRLKMKTNKIWRLSKFKMNSKKI